MAGSRSPSPGRKSSPASPKITPASPKVVGTAITTKPRPVQPPPCFDEFEHDIPVITQFFTYLSYAIIMLFGYTREFFRVFFPKAGRKTPDGYAPLVRDYDDFFQRRLYRRIRDCWNRPIDSRPSRIIGVMERVSHDYNATFELTGRIIPSINLGSYNYLGFAEDTPSITSSVLESIDQFGVASCSAALEAGQHSVLTELEADIADFVGKEDAVVCGMGFATNFGGLPALFCKDTLVLSDSLNHASLVAGVRQSGCKVRVYPHNNMQALERILRREIAYGQPRTHKRYKRVVLLVEGIYSMEGIIIDLAAIVALKKKYNALLYVDEAHSIGAIGVSARGVCEYCCVNPQDVDVLMGTFTKSFGSIGGYIAADKSIIDYVRGTASFSVMSDSLAAPCAQQALATLKVLRGEDGTDLGARRIQQLAWNSKFFRRGLINLGLTVFGNDASPVIPVMLYNPGKIASFSRKCLERNLAVVVVGYPATSLVESRARFCVSACHTREDLEQALRVIKEVAEEIHITYQPENIGKFDSVLSSL
ncbi:serine palmitoyltransferase, putative [Bodo saltans]|uniref:serine C-palmitoyltransferase n=1 Tax=Bodo saltans TaxID=75058 RepID=A0A0S4JWE9_BODSA|nr:serine palmitoyltransferase, putative [Bodo saltans]|eukprot:CUG92893.1 serine palmitoyltransferase, putative [Bodo saltans]